MGEVTGKLRNDVDRYELINRLKSYDFNIRGPLFYEFTAIEPTRTKRQNNLLWFYYSIIKKHIKSTLGEDYRTDDLHDYFVNKFCGAKIITIRGEDVMVRARTSKMSKSEFSNYIEQLQEYCATSLDLILPEPGL